MDKNLHTNNLEDFLKKSFEDYTESPPDKVWENIASEIELPVAPVKVIILYKWMIGAAAALVLGIAAYQLLDVKTELKELQQQVEQHDSTLQKMQAPSVKSDITENEKHDRNIIPPVPEESFYNDKTKYDASVSNDINKQELKSKTLPSPKRSTQEPKNIIAFAQNQDRNHVKIPMPIITNNEKNSTNKSLETELSNSNIITSIENKTENSINKNAERLAITTFDKLTVLEMPFVSTNHKIELPYNYPITSVLKKNNFFVGVQFLPMKSWGEVTAVSRRPGFPGREKNFSQNANYAGESLLGGLSIGTKLGQSWSVESGLYYRTTSHSATTRPEFQFQDRHPRRPGDPRFDFICNLNTPTGVVALALAAEPSNSSQSIGEEESLAFEVTTVQKASYISLPILLQYQSPGKRFHFIAKGGLLINFLLDEDFQISTVNSLNSKLRLPPNIPSMSAQESLNSTTVDYWLGAGLAYDLNSNMSLSLEPTFLKTFSRQNIQNTVQSSNYALGLNAGLTLNF